MVVLWEARRFGIVRVLRSRGGTIDKQTISSWNDNPSVLGRLMFARSMRQEISR